MRRDAHNHRGLFVLISCTVFIASMAAGIGVKNAISTHTMSPYSVHWNDSVGSMHADIAYGKGESQQFDLYLPADAGKSHYGLVVYLHAGGFTSGDKADDTQVLQWLCSKGYVAAGINYTLQSEANPDANIATQSQEIKNSMTKVIAAAKDYGYPINEMAIGGGSAGGTLALLYAYRDAHDSPVPVKMAFAAVSPTSFYPEDWSNYGFDKPENHDAAAAMFSLMSGEHVSADMFGTAEYNNAMSQISALHWINNKTVPTVLIYGKHDKLQPFSASLRLDQALTEHHVPHEYIVCDHSGHGLQNDTAQYRQYMDDVNAYLDRYMPSQG